MGGICCKKYVEVKAHTLETGPIFETIGDAERDTVDAFKAAVNNNANYANNPNEAYDVNTGMPNGIDEHCSILEHIENDKDGINPNNSKNPVKQATTDKINLISQLTSEIDDKLRRIEITEEFIKQKELRIELEKKRSKNKEKEQELEERKREIIEKESLQINLKNLDEEHYSDVEFSIEVLFTRTEDLENCFSIGKTVPKTMKRGSIIFDNIFEFNFLFARTQFIRILITSSDGNFSEIRINLAKIIISRVKELLIPINLLEQEIIEFNNIKANKINNTLPFVELNFQRLTKEIYTKVPTFYVEFNFIFAAKVANRLRYEVITVKKEDEIKVIYSSNELIGKSPNYFAAATFKNKDDLLDQDVLTYVFEFYEKDKYYGQVRISKIEMNNLLTSIEPVTFTVSNEKKALHEIVVKKPKVSTKSNLHIKLNNSTNDSALKIDHSMNSAKTPRIDHSSCENLGGLKILAKISKGKDNKPAKFLKKVDSASRLGLEVAKVNQSDKNTPVDSQFNFQKGKVVIRYVEKPFKTFFDLKYEGLNLAFDIAIDYTSSNGDPRKESSFHTLNLENNKYVKAIISLGSILKEYDDDQNFPLYGFGGVPQKGKEVSHCFNVNSKKSPVVSGMDEVINTYLSSLNTVEFVGPTYFQEVIKTETENIKKELKVQKKDDPLNYHVCLILTDGKIEDMNETKEMLIEAAKLPISIIIVGIGNDDFSRMETLGKLLKLLIIIDRKC